MWFVNQLTGWAMTSKRELESRLDDLEPSGDTETVELENGDVLELGERSLCQILSPPQEGEQ